MLFYENTVYDLLYTLAHHLSGVTVLTHNIIICHPLFLKYHPLLSLLFDAPACV